MASGADASAPAQEPPASPRRGPGGGRGRGRGGAPRGDARGRGRGGSRGRGRAGNREDGASHTENKPSEKSLGKARVADDGAAPKGVLPPKASTDEEDDDAEVCFICASPIQHIAVSPCNHRTCHICSLRLRALYKVKTCAHCRAESDYVIFTDDATKNYEDFAPSDFFHTDKGLGIKFENENTLADTQLLLRFNCPDESCDVACLGWADLHRHVQTAHQRKMCDLCTRNKKVFTYEHELFTPAELAKHKKFGDDNPGAVDQSGFKGHPECGFCRLRFYGDDELYTHCRDKHERCHICDRRNGGQAQQYYQDYDALEEHFKKDHFLCPDRECLEKKFVVFDSEIDLKAHQLEAHPQGLSKDALRDARRVDMSGFQLRQTEPEPSRRGGRREAGRGRGRDPNAEPLPVSSAQPMTRAELAYQRQMAIQSSQPGGGRTFGGQLTSQPTPSEAFAARPTANAPAPTTVTASRPRGAPSDNTAAASTPSAPRTPQEQARLMRHSAVTERAANMLKNDQAKLAEFRSHVSAYKNSRMAAAELIDSFFSLFDTDAAELGKLIKELAEIFEIQQKRDDLLKAWNDWKAINEDYPSLPGAAAALSLGGSSTGHGGSRVLKLKKATAQSLRSAVHKQASWSTASSSMFPPLASSSRPSASSSHGIGAKPGQTPWASSSGTAPRASASASGSASASPMPSRATSSTSLNRKPAAKVSSAGDFPALPAAAKPTTTLFSPGYRGGVVRRDHSGRSTPVGNAWAPPPAAGGSASAQEDESAGGKKGKKNKKQTLFHFG